MGSTKNAKKDKRQKSKEAAKDIQKKQSLKKRQQNNNIDNDEKVIKSKKEERVEYIASLSFERRINNRNKRVEAQLVDKKARENYQKSFNYAPKLEKDEYLSK